MRFSHRTVEKGVFINSHEYKDIVEDRQTVFLSQWKECQHRLWFSMRTYLEVGGTRQHQKPLIQVTHDKSAFNAKDGKENGEREKGSNLFAFKSGGRGLGFLA